MKNPKEGFELTAGRANGSVGYNEALNQLSTNLNCSLVFALFDLPDFSSSPIWMADKLQISVEEVLETLEGLQVLGLIRQSEKGFEAICETTDHLARVTTKDPASHFSEWAEKHSIMAQQALNLLTGDSIRGFRHDVFPSNPEIIYWMTEEITKVIQEGRRRSEHAGKSEVYISSYTVLSRVGGK